MGANGSSRMWAVRATRSWSPRLADERHQGVVRDGLHEMVVDAGVVRTPTVLLGPIAGDRDDRGSPAPLLPPEMLGDLPAVHPGQADVQQHEHRPVRPGRLE